MQTLIIFLLRNNITLLSLGYGTCDISRARQLQTTQNKGRPHKLCGCHSDISFRGNVWEYAKPFEIAIIRHIQLQE